MIVDTETLARAAGLSVRQIQRLAAAGTITSVGIRTGRLGRPTRWFDLNTSITALANRPRVSLTDH